MDALTVSLLWDSLAIVKERNGPRNFNLSAVEGFIHAKCCDLKSQFELPWTESPWFVGYLTLWDYVRLARYSLIVQKTQQQRQAVRYLDLETALA
jgi:hypothetical protein